MVIELLDRVPRVDDHSLEPIELLVSESGHLLLESVIVLAHMIELLGQELVHLFVLEMVLTDFLLLISDFGTVALNAPGDTLDLDDLVFVFLVMGFVLSGLLRGFCHVPLMDGF